MRPPVSVLPTEEAQELKELVKRRSQLMEMLEAEKSRRSRVTSESARSSLQAHIEWLRSERDDTEARMGQMIGIIHVRAGVCVANSQGA